MVSVRQSVCLSCSLTGLHCAKTAKMDQGSVWGEHCLAPRDIVLHWGPDPPEDRGRGLTFKFWDFLVSPERT